MRMEGLSFDNIPAIHIPFRFFNTAPWMGVLAAVVMFFAGSDGFVSQWTPALLAITHLLTLGFMLMVMFGALFQLLPVISGEAIPYASKIVSLVHITLVLGVLLLVCGFIFQQYLFFHFALPVFLLAFITFLGSLGSLLLKNIRGGESIFSIRLAAVALLLTIFLGMLRAWQYMGFEQPFSVANLAQLHLAWGLSGWVLLLVMGVSYQVIPMFHVTPNYPRKLAIILPSAIFSLLCLLSVLSNMQSGTSLVAGLVALLCSQIVIYAGYSLWLLTQRKRKIRDLTVQFWRLALLSLLLLAVLLLISVLAGSKSVYASSLHLAIGIVAIYGFACSVIMGMLQKIIPFLAYLHLQRQCMINVEMLATLPNMREIISEKQSQWQLRLHLIALLMLLVTVVVPELAPISAMAMAIDFVWLGLCIALASRSYNQHSRRVSSV